MLRDIEATSVGELGEQILGTDHVEFATIPAVGQVNVLIVERRQASQPHKGDGGTRPKLPHRSNVVPIRKVLGDLATEHTMYMDGLNLERAPVGCTPVS